MKKLDYILLSFLLFIALSFRIYKINTPLADLHSWRQVDTAAVARNYIKNGFDLLHPKYDDLSSIQSGVENPSGYRMVEFPLYNAAIALAYKTAPALPLEQWGRIISVFSSLITLAIIYYLVLKEKNRLAAFFASLIFAVFPFFVFFSRTVLPETIAVALSFLSIYFLYLANPKHATRYTLHVILSVVSFSTALLIKPTTIFFAFTLIYLFFKKYQWSIYKKPFFYLYFILAVLPLYLWRDYIKAFPEGIPFNEWLLTGVNTSEGLKRIFFRPAFFRWVFFERINALILGGYLTVFLVIGALAKHKSWLFGSLLLSSFAYLFVFQGGNVQHEYYQILILPTLAIFTALGINLIFENKKIFPVFYSVVATISLILFSWYISYFQVRNYYNYSTDLVQMAKIISSLTEPNDKIVTDRTGDTTLLYLAGRRGAPSIFRAPEDLKKAGYIYLITSDRGQIESMYKDSYQLIFENDSFSMFKL